MLPEEGGQIVVDQRPVGLDGVDDPLPGSRVLPLQLDGAPEEVQTHHGGLAALPGHGHLGRPVMGLDQLADVGLQQRLGHPEAAARIQPLLGEVEAVRAVEVADGAGRLGQEMEGWRPRAGGRPGGGWRRRSGRRRAPWRELAGRAVATAGSPGVVTGAGAQGAVLASLIRARAAGRWRSHREPGRRFRSEGHRSLAG